MSRRTAEQLEAPGGDSFLDVVANLVGILILLVMVVAAAAQRTAVEPQAAAEAAPAKKAAPLPNFQAAEAAANAVEGSIHDVQRKLRQEEQAIAIKMQQRQQLQVLVTVAEQRLGEHRDTLSAAEQEQFDTQKQLAALEAQLRDLSLADAAAAQKPPEVLPHIPTPMARTVFGKEIHFRLQDGKIAFVPWEEMLERMKTEAPKNVQRLRDTPRAEFSLPVYAGFGGKYILRRVEQVVSGKYGPQRQQGVELEKIYFVQADPQLGEPVERALQPGSQFRSQLGGSEPGQTTVTLWVYPESFEHFRTVKQELFKLGYLTAGRPLPDGVPIGGSPRGTRSAAE